MTSSWDPDTRQALIFYKWVFSFLGVWPLRDEGILETIHLGLIIFALVGRTNIIRESMTFFTSGSYSVIVGRLLVQTTLVIPQCIDLYFNWENLGNTIDNLTSNVSIVSVIFKLVTLRFYKDNMVACVNSVIDDWERTKDNEYRKIMKRHRAFGRIACVGTFSMAYSTCVMFFAMAIVVTVTTDCSAQNLTMTCKVLPLPSNYIMDTKIPPIYESLFLLQMFQVFISATGNNGTDTFIFFLAMHVCGQLEILKIEFRKMGRGTVSLRSSVTEVEIYRSEMASLTKRHYELISFSKNLHDTFNVMILTQLLVSSILICVVGFQFMLFLEAGNTVGAGKHMLYTIVLMIQLFLYSYAGDYLQTQSSDLVYAAYESPWYEMPPSVARDILFVMVRAGHPLEISAGDFFAMTLEKFTDIVKTSVSYLSVLRVLVK